MNDYEGLRKGNRSNPQGLIDNILRKGTPDRVYHWEIFHDREIRDAIAGRFDLMKGVPPNDPNFERKKLIAVNRFCGWDYVTSCVSVGFEHHGAEVNGRGFQDEHTGPIMSWEDFEKFDWPDPDAPQLTAELEWFQENLPDDMCIVGGLTGHFAEELSFLMGYETLCYALFDQRDLIRAISDKLLEIYRTCVQRTLAYDRVRIIYPTDDMGFKTGLLISPDDTRQFVLKNHKALSEMTHAAGRLYVLHSCGKLADIIDDLIDDVKIDAKHSFEDAIEDVCEVKQTYGRRIALLGGIDMDFLCRSSDPDIRKRVRDTLDACQPGGGYCLGTGNSVANYIPLDNYLAMVDEGMLYDGA